MGSLHDGHLSLIRESKLNCDLSVVSIFVNPTQFGPTEDYDSYPRKLQEDISLLKNLNVDVLFLPSNESFYPKKFSTYVDEEKLSIILEGKSRPQFFKGVMTVVIKLLNIIKPNYAYFGKKDMQQLKVIQKMVEDLNIDVKIFGLETVREPSGLAMSSRNDYFSIKRRGELGTVFNALKAGEGAILSGNRDSVEIKNIIKKKLLEIKNIQIEYVDIGDFSDLKSVKTINNSVVISLAVLVDGVRLIDNLEVFLTL